MTDDLLPYYNRELGYLRQMAEEFAEAHPKIAKHLRLSGDAIDDPHIARLIESVAFLNARTASKLDDEFPELSSTLLDVLYPHYLAPIPSMAIVQFRPSAEITGPQLIPVDTEIDSEAVDGESCCFRTRYPVTLLPITLFQGELTGRPVAAPANSKAVGAMSALKLALRCIPDGVTFSQLRPDTLRFFLRGQPSQMYPLQQLILNNTISVALADGPDDPEPVILPPSAVRPVGLDPDEALLPYPDQSLIAYRLLTEFFVFPEKFLFIDIDVREKVSTSAGRDLYIYLYFDSANVTLERSVSKDMFALGCTPIINLFRQRAEPVLVSHNRFEYRVIPDARRQRALEVHSVLSVTQTDASGGQRPITPLYARRSGADIQSDGYWSSSRRKGAGDDGTEVYLSFTNPRVAFAREDWVVSVDTLCSNRDLPTKLPYGGGHPLLSIRDGANLGNIACISPLTRPLRLKNADSYHWRLISHLTLNHLSLLGEQGPETFREILRLYDFHQSPETIRMIEGVSALIARRGVARAPSQPGEVPWSDAVIRGVDISIELDPANFVGNGIFLFAMVLDCFFGLFASINSFTRLTATMKGQPGTLRTWPARAGHRQIL